MTTTPELPVIRTQSALIASCAPLLGFEPDDCVVAFITGVPGRHSPVLARLDLGDGQDLRERAQVLVERIVATGGIDVHLVAWSRSVPDDSPRHELVATGMLTALQSLLAQRGVPLGLAVATNGRVAWRQCGEVGCCLEPEQLDVTELLSTRSEFVFAGFAPMSSREVLAASLHPEPDRVAEVARLMAAFPALPEEDSWRRARIREVCRVLMPTEISTTTPANRRSGTAPMAARRSAAIHRALADVGIRDAVLLRLIRSTAGREQWHLTCERLADLVRCAPAGKGAGAASLLVVAAWMRGDGALAWIALESALRHDPDYRLAVLLDQVLSHGIDPARWRASFGDLTEERCLSVTASGVRRLVPVK